MPSSAWWRYRSQKPHLISGVLLGAFLVLVALLAEFRAGGSPGFGLLQWTMLVAGLGLGAVGWYGREVVRLYIGLALIVLNVALLLVAAEIVATVVLNLTAPSVPTEITVSQAAYYRGEPWSETFARETNESRRLVRYEPYVLWQRTAYRGETVNIDSSGARVTPGADCQPGAFTVLTFGGSTMWGVGAPDWSTISAFLQQGLARRMSRPVCVRNLGEVGFVSTQEVVKLLRVLEGGLVPDLVVFYDGINDVIAAQDAGRPGVHYGLRDVQTRMEISPARRLLTRLRLSQLLARAKTSQRVDLRSDSALAGGIASTYLENRRIVAALAAEYGFAYEFFWQPVLVIGREPADAEERRWVDAVPASLVALYRRVYPIIEQASRETPHLSYLGSLFDETKPPVYADFGHLVPPANAMVADVILARLKE